MLEGVKRLGWQRASLERPCFYLFGMIRQCQLALERFMPPISAEFHVVQGGPFLEPTSDMPTADSIMNNAIQNSW